MKRLFSRKRKLRKRIRSLRHLEEIGDQLLKLWWVQSKGTQSMITKKIQIKMPQIYLKVWTFKNLNTLIDY